MSEVSLPIGGRAYRVACAAGEEDRVTRLGAVVADKLAAMGNLSGHEAQNLLFAALLLADEVHEGRDVAARAADEIAAARSEADTANGHRDRLEAKITHLEAELARLQSALQASAGESESAAARVTDLTEELAGREADLARASAELADLRGERDALASRSAAGGGPLTGANDADLAPALEKLAEMLEICADKLESGTPEP